MFCPNCGAQNQDTATACAKCGFALKAASAAPKFKGTMLMMNAPPSIPRPGGAGAPAAGAPPPAAQAAPVAPPAAAPAAPAAAAGPKPKLKGTMIGVAPPSLGSNTPAFGTAPNAPTPAAPTAGPAFSTTARSASPAAPPAEPASAVNPLGGTVVADAGAFGGGFPGAPPQQVPAPPAAMGGYEPAATEAFGAPPPGFGGTQPAGFGGTQPAGFGAPPPGFAGQHGGYDSPGVDPNAMPVHQPNAPMHYGGDEPLPPIPGTVGGPNAIVTVLLIVLTCGLYGIYLLIKGRRSASS